MMFHGPILCIPRTEAVRRAGDYLSEAGFHITRTPAPDISHVLLPVPSFSAGDEYLAHFLADLPDDVIISGGNLSSPLLEGYATIDFLKDPYYLAENAAITADCALRIAYQHFPAVMRNTPVLILGWGRIAKCLTQLLSAIGAQVTVAARKESNLAMARALGYNSIPFSDLQDHLSGYRIIFNTVPAMVLPATLSRCCRSDCLKIDLASTPGIEGEDLIIARGLPGKLAPESAGNLIGKTTLELTRYKEVSS